MPAARWNATGGMPLVEYLPNAGEQPRRCYSTGYTEYARPHRETEMARIQSRLSDPWDIAPPPLQKNGRPQMNTGGEGVWARSKAPEAAYRWVAFMEGKEGQRIWSKRGTDLPGRKSVLTDFAAGKLFDDPQLAPPNNRLWLDIVPKSEKTHMLTKEANDAYTVAWNDVVAGKVGAKEAFTEANRLAAPFLKQG